MSLGWFRPSGTGPANVPDRSPCPRPGAPRTRTHASRSFQTPVEIPGVSNIDFLRIATNSRRKALGEKELDPLEFYAYVMPKAGLGRAALSRHDGVGMHALLAGAGVGLTSHYARRLVAAAAGRARASSSSWSMAATECCDPMCHPRAPPAQVEMLNMEPSFLNRNVNEGFSGGEKKRNEILQLACLEADLSILDEIDSGLDIDALRDVADAVNGFRAARPKAAVVMVTHYKARPGGVPALVDAGQGGGCVGPCALCGALLGAGCHATASASGTGSECHDYWLSSRCEGVESLPPRMPPSSLQRLLEYIEPDFVHIMQASPGGGEGDFGGVDEQLPGVGGKLHLKRDPGHACAALHGPSRSAAPVTCCRQEGRIVKTGGMDLVHQLEEEGYKVLSPAV